VQQTHINEDIPLPFDLPAVARKKVNAAFDGGRITSDGGVMLLAQAERRLSIANQLAAAIPDGRDASRVTHLLPDFRRARIPGRSTAELAPASRPPPRVSTSASS